MSKKQKHPILGALELIEKTATECNQLHFFHSFLAVFLFNALEANKADHAIMGADDKVISIKKVPTSDLEGIINEAKAAVKPTLH